MRTFQECITACFIAGPRRVPVPVVQLLRPAAAHARRREAEVFLTIVRGTLVAEADRCPQATHVIVGDQNTPALGTLRVPKAMLRRIGKTLQHTLHDCGGQPRHLQLTPDEVLVARRIMREIFGMVQAPMSLWD
jgi:hypothetical protein